MGGRGWPRVGFLRDPNDAQNESITNLPLHTEPAGSAALARAYEAGKHRALSGHLGR